MERKKKKEPFLLSLSLSLLHPESLIVTMHCTATFFTLPTTGLMVKNARRPAERGREKTAREALAETVFLFSFLFPVDFRVPWASVRKQLLGLCQCVAGLGCTLGALVLSLSLSCRSLLLIMRDDRTE